MKVSVSVGTVLGLISAWALFSIAGNVSWYQFTTAVGSVRNLLNLPQEDVQKCINAYQYFMNGTHTSDTTEETEHVRAYYAVINQVLAIADIEKMYIPPQIDSKKGLFDNQMIWEKRVAHTLNVGSDSKLLDIGCGRGRISHHFQSIIGGKVSGFNIDANQIQNAKEYALATGLQDRLDFKVSDHHKRFPYEDESFDGAYSFQAVWPFFKVEELDSVANEMFRVLKPGSRYSCSEYLLTPHFNLQDKYHNELHARFLPTLAATQSRYPLEVTNALERAGFKLVLSAPSVAPAWPLTDQKTDLFLFMRSIVIGLTSIGMCPVWVETLVNNLFLGGVAWADAEKMKIADLNWQIIVEKPLK